MMKRVGDGTQGMLKQAGRLFSFLFKTFFSPFFYRSPHSKLETFMNACKWEITAPWGENSHNAALHELERVSRRKKVRGNLVQEFKTQGMVRLTYCGKSGNPSTKLVLSLVIAGYGVDRRECLYK